MLRWRRRLRLKERRWLLCLVLLLLCAMRIRGLGGCRSSRCWRLLWVLLVVAFRSVVGSCG